MKRLFNIFIIVLLASVNLFAKSGLEIGIFVPLGIGVGINEYALTNNKATQQQQENFNTAVKQANRKSWIGFDAGVSFHIGYRFSINRDFSFSLLGEIGYAHDEFAFYRKSGDKKYENSFNYMFESIAFGIYPKLNWKKFSFGINAGIKVPLYTRVMSSYLDYNALNITRNIEHYNVSQLKKLFDLPIIPYLRFSIDYSIYTNKKFAIALGGYIGGDFGITLKNPILDNQTLAKMTKQTMSSFDIGFHVGIKILPNN